MQHSSSQRKALWVAGLGQRQSWWKAHDARTLRLHVTRMGRWFFSVGASEDPRFFGALGGWRRWLIWWCRTCSGGVASQLHLFFWRSSLSYWDRRCGKPFHLSNQQSRLFNLAAFLPYTPPSPPSPLTHISRPTINWRHLNRRNQVFGRKRHLCWSIE